MAEKQGRLRASGLKKQRSLDVMAGVCPWKKNKSEKQQCKSVLLNFRAVIRCILPLAGGGVQMKNKT
jgi:hypothetical protein